MATYWDEKPATLSGALKETRGSRRQLQRHLELAHHRRPQAHRRHVWRHCLPLLPAGRIRGAAPAMQLAQPNGDFLNGDQYNRLFTMHGTTMVFMVVMPMSRGLLQPDDPADDRRPGRRVPAAERVQLLDVPGWRAVPQRQLLHRRHLQRLARRARRRLVLLRDAVLEGVHARARQWTSGSSDCRSWASRRSPAV